MCQQSATRAAYLLFQLRRHADELVHCIFSPNILKKEMIKSMIACVVGTTTQNRCLHLSEGGPLAPRHEDHAGLGIVRHYVVATGRGGVVGVRVDGQRSDACPGAEHILSTQTQFGVEVLGRFV